MRPDTIRPEWILAFDTSAAHCAAALLCGDRHLARYEEMAKGQAERLVPLLEEMLAEAGIGWTDLCAIGVGTGPGNFTGVRISVALARGLALGLGIPAIGVTVLEAMALGATLPVTVMLDARRDEVYAQSFAKTGPAFAKTGPAFAKTGPGAARIVAADIAKAEAVGVIIGHSGAPARYPLAEAVARIADERRHGPQPRPAPFYLRGADAAPASDPPPVILP